MITIFHLDNSRSERIVWLMEELGEHYEQKTFLRNDYAGLRDIHPLGKAPVIRDGGQVVFESGAIVEHLLRRYGKGRLHPVADSLEGLRYLEFMHFAEGSAMPALVNVFLLRRALGDQAESNPMLQAMLPRADAMLNYLDAELTARPYFAGAEFTAADIMMEFCLTFQERVASPDWATTHPHIHAWLQRLRARPAYQRMLKVATPKKAF